MQRPGRERRAAPLLAWGLAALGACGGHNNPCVPCAAAELDETGSAPITAVEAGVEEVQVGPAAGMVGEPTFQLSAWYRDANQKVISGRFDPFVWELDPDTDGGVTPYGLVTLKPAAASDLTVRVKNDAGTLADQVTLKRWADAATVGVSSDVVEAAHQPREPPNAVLLEEVSLEDTCTWGAARAFVGLAAVGRQRKVPCSVVILSAGNALVYQQPTSWTNPFTPGLAAPLDLEITVFIAVTGRTASLLSNAAFSTDDLTNAVAAGAMAQAALDVTWANMVFEANRVGIRLKATYVQLDPSTPDLAGTVGAHPFDCSKPRGLPARDRNNAAVSYQYDKEALSVYYVDWIDYPSDPRHAGARGVHCHFWYLGSPGPVVFISYSRHSTITLAHEISHALGLVDEEEALGVTNVMNNLSSDGPLGADARSRLSVGQVFRMNVWNDSWITKVHPAARIPRLCRTWMDPCPPVALDAR